MPNIGQELASLDFASMLGGPLTAIVNAQAQAALSSVNFIKTVGFEPTTLDASGNPVPGKPVYVSFKYPKEVAPFKPATGDFVSRIVVTGAGVGYATIPDVVISGGGGTGATATATITSAGSVNTVTIDNGGSGYTSVPSVVIVPKGTATATTAATATATVGTPAVAAQIQEMQLEVPILTMLPIPFIRIEEATIDFHAKLNSVEFARTDTELGLKADFTVAQRWPGGGARLNASFSYQKKTSQGITVDRTYSMDVHIKAVQDELPAGLDRLLGILEKEMREQPTGSLPPTVVKALPPS